MTAELCDNLSLADLIIADFCLLDYRYEELSILLNSEDFRNEFEKIGDEGIAFLHDAEDFLETRDETGIHEPTDISTDESVRRGFSYRLPLGLIIRFDSYLYYLSTVGSKQEYYV